MQRATASDMKLFSEVPFCMNGCWHVRVQLRPSGNLSCQRPCTRSERWAPKRTTIVSWSSQDHTVPTQLLCWLVLPSRLPEGNAQARADSQLLEAQRGWIHTPDTKSLCTQLQGRTAIKIQKKRNVKTPLHMHDAAALTANDDSGEELGSQREKIQHTSSCSDPVPKALHAFWLFLAVLGDLAHHMPATCWSKAKLELFTSRTRPSQISTTLGLVTCTIHKPNLSNNDAMPSLESKASMV